MRVLKPAICFFYGLLITVFVQPLLAQTYTWSNVVVPAGGFVAGVDYSPVSQGLIYARTDIGGVYRWDNATSLWIPLTDMFNNSLYNYYGGESIAPDPVNANNVYVAAGMYMTSGNGVILSSTNQGNSWTVNSIAVPMGGNYDGREAGERLAVDPNLNSILYFGSRSNGLWKSTNSAASWAQVAGFPVNGDATYGLSYVVFLPGGNPSSGAETIFVGVEAMASGNSNLYRSTNAGASWTLVPGGPTNMITPHASLGTDGNLWVVYDSGGYGPNNITTGQVWKLNTSTLAWSQITMPGPPAASGGFGGINVDAENAQHVVVSTIDWWSGPDMVFSTTNGGSSWTTIGHVNVGYGSNFANYNINGAEWTLGCGTVAGGTGWQGDVKIDPYNSANALYTTGAGVWSSTNITAASTSSVTWSFTDYGLEETAVTDMTSSAAGGVFFSSLGDIGGMRHTNLAVSPAGGMYCNPSWSSTEGIDFAELNTNDFVRVENSGAIATDGAYSTNNGQTFTNFSTLPETSDNEMQGIAISANGATIIAVPYSGYGNPSYSINWGTSWTACTGLPGGAQIASDRVDSNIFYGTSGTTLYVSTNGGSSFASAGTFAGSGRPRAVFGMVGEVWVPTGSGLYRFTNVGLGTVTTTKIANVSSAVAIGFGMADSPTYTHPAVYLVGTVSGTYGFFRCDDGIGTTWTLISNSNQLFGAVGTASGDETVYGRMYIGTNGRGILHGDLVAGVTNTPTGTPTATRTNSPTNTRTFTPTNSPTPTRTDSPTNTATSTPTETVTLTPTNTLVSTATATLSSTPSNSPTATRSASATNTATSSPTSTNSNTPTNTVTKTATFTPTNTLANTATQTATTTATASNTPTSSPTNTLANTATLTATSTVSNTATKTATSTPTNTFANTATQTATSTPTDTVTNSVTETPSLTASNTTTSTTTSTPTPTLANTATQTATDTPTATVSNTATKTTTSTPTDTATQAATATPTNTVTNTSTTTPTSTVTSTDSPTITSTPTNTNVITSTYTGTPTNSPSSTVSNTVTPTPTVTPTNSLTNTTTPTPTSTASNTATKTTTLTLTNTFTNTATGTATATPTNTPVNTATPTATPANSLTSTATDTPTLTATSSATSAITLTVTSTMVPATLTSTETSTPAASKGVVIYPNPVTGPTVNVLPPAYSGVSTVEVEIFTTAFRKVQEETFLNVPPSVAVTVQLTDKWGTPLANGLYYLVVIVDGQRSVAKLLILR